MTIEIFDPPGPYTIATAGPHEIPFPYATGAVIATIVTPEGLVIELDPDTDFTVDPAENLTGAGDLTLSGAIFTEYEGAQLYIDRATSLEQGWLGQMTREKGLEAQLDATVMAVQEQAALRRRTLRSTEDLAPIAPAEDGTVLMWDGGNLVPGPLADEVAGAQAAAIAAETARTLAQAAAQVLAGVRAFGAGLGVDDTAAFSAAALAADAIDNVGLPWSAVPHAEVCRVLVPAGYYTLSSLVDTGGREVTWVLDPATFITGIEYINGTVERSGRVTRQHALGTLDQAVGRVYTVGGDYTDKPAPVTGVIDTQGAADYAQRDAVALVAAAYASPAVIDVGTATYTPTTATIAAPGADAVKRLRKGAIIYTKHSPKCAGILASWNADGSVLTVAEWREDGGSSAVTPANGTGLSIGVDKIWAGNGVVVLTPEGFATQAIGWELSVRNTRADSVDDIDDPTNRVWGYLSAAAAEGTPGYYKSLAAFIARGDWIYGYFADNQDTGFGYRSSVAGGKTAFKSRSHFDNIILLATDTTDKQRYAISGRGDVTHGDPTVAAASGRHIQFATSGLSAAYDVRLTAIGGTASAGQGILGAYAKQIGLNTVTPDASACLDLSLSPLGFLPPRMSTTSRDAIPSPTNGLQIWNVTTGKTQVRTASGWVDMH